MSNIIKFAAIAVLALSASFVSANQPLTPTQEKAARLEAEAKAAQEEVAKERAMAKAQAKAAWDSKTFTEAWKIRGQNTVDASQYVGGKAVQGLATVDGYIGAGVAYPVIFVTAGAFDLAAGSKEYAAKAWDNEVQVAVKAEPKK